MVDPDTEGLLREIDDGPFVSLRLLADKERDRGEDKLAAAFDWLVAWRKEPVRQKQTDAWEWSYDPVSHEQVYWWLPELPIGKRELFFTIYQSLSEAYLAAAKALAEAMPIEFLNQRPKAKKGKK